MGYDLPTVTNKGKQMELTLQGRKITVDSAYLLFASVMGYSDLNAPEQFQKEVEFFVCGFDSVKDARKHGRKLQNYPGIESVWIIRRRDMEVVQPHEKF